MNDQKYQLTEKEYWDSLYDKHSGRQTGESKHKKLKVCLEAKFGREMVEVLGAGYSNYVFWQRCKQFLPQQKNLKVLEVGSAPGDFLVRFNKMFGYIPYGVEYSKKGVSLNRAIFLSNCLNADHVIHADFFSDDFQEKYTNFFDIVVSRGFVEHFSNPKAVIEKHTNLLKKGGICVITIPNIAGINYVLSRLLYEPILKQHNLAIMRRDCFKNSFEDTKLSILFLDYYGIFDPGLFIADKAYKQPVIAFFHICRYFLSAAFFLLLRGKSFESATYSPYLMCVAKKEPRQ
jgi:SAM-dependent methyltransferase